MNKFFQPDHDMLDIDDDITDVIVEEEKPEQGLEVLIGSNVFRTTNGVIKLQGKEQIVLEVLPANPALLLTMDFYDERGQRIGHIRRNQLSTTGSSRYAVSVTTAQDATIDGPMTVTVSNRATGGSVIEVCLFQRRKIRLASASFYTHKGELVSVTPHYCRIGTELTKFGDVIECRGSAAAIG